MPEETDSPLSSTDYDVDGQEALASTFTQSYNSQLRLENNFKKTL